MKVAHEHREKQREDRALPSKNETVGMVKNFGENKDFRCLLKSGRKRKKILYLKPICTEIKEKNCGFSLSPLPPPTLSFHFQTLAYMVGFHFKKGIIPGDCRLEDKPLISITNTTNKYVLCCCQTAREE